MTIEKILLIGLAIAGVVLFTNFFDAGVERAISDAGDFGKETTEIKNTLFDFSGK